MKRKTQLLIVFCLLLVVIYAAFLHDYIQEAMHEEPDETLLHCELPYVQLGLICCLDENGNNICDIDEVPLEGEPDTLKSAYITIDEVHGMLVLNYAGISSLDFTAKNTGEVNIEEPVYGFEVYSGPNLQIWNNSPTYFDFNVKMDSTEVRSSAFLPPGAILSNELSVNMIDSRPSNAS